MHSTRARSSRRSICLGLIGIGLGLGVVTTAPFSTPAEAAGCSAAQIAVVVSFNELGGGTQSACIDDVDSGFEALDVAGFSVTPVAGQPFVCRINDLPATDPCQRIPSATAYWGYWTAPMGGSWSYATLGASAHDPEPGGVQGWSFGADIEPGIAPPAPASPEGAGASTASAGQPDSETQPPSPTSGGPPWAVLAAASGVGGLAVLAYAHQRRRRSASPPTGGVITP